MDQPRIPPGQTLTTGLPVLDLGLRPDLRPENWSLALFGLVEQELRLDWDHFQSLPREARCSDFHCVTHWSRLDAQWEGVAAKTLIALARPLADARFVTLHGADGYTTNLPLEALLDPDVLLADGLDGGPLADAHGGPVRLVVPRRYAWKSAKWLVGLEFHAEDRPGYWEVRGYHNDADPWKEERYAE
ncbi:sulfite oxidase-like oxidoreductase [Azospira inquinata]|uniref:Sulfite oxidase-like oxidoreductase n=1 Tax=Azospira inquinata TaxID=2785627 RepID=A0A975SP22_9RHOO|nr:sulfite oxidase-like oxidoreductase [Azospira inquinata]QWT45066.1 sulfite oxidase-like oxidoreductase [Azospira inquinata]QWT49601.1 sulfite oxidase-like oxidoreductase [Azospira inquinata]